MSSGFLIFTTSHILAMKSWFGKKKVDFQVIYKEYAIISMILKKKYINPNNASRG